jgi:hypothetical protein
LPYGVTYDPPQSYIDDYVGINPVHDGNTPNPGRTFWGTSMKLGSRTNTLITGMSYDAGPIISPISRDKLPLEYSLYESHPYFYLKPLQANSISNIDAISQVYGTYTSIPWINGDASLVTYTGPKTNRYYYSYNYFRQATNYYTNPNGVHNQAQTETTDYAKLWLNTYNTSYTFLNPIGVVPIQGQNGYTNEYNAGDVVTYIINAKVNTDHDGNIVYVKRVDFLNLINQYNVDLRQPILLTTSGDPDAAIDNERTIGYSKYYQLNKNQAYHDMIIGDDKSLVNPPILPPKPAHPVLSSSSMRVSIQRPSSGGSRFLDFFSNFF